MSGRIHWQDEEATGNTIGRVGSGGSYLFCIWQANAGAGKWRLTSTLPGQDEWHLYRDDPGVLKAEAEKWLERFVSSLGAVFPGGHPEGNAIEPYCATGAGDGDGRHLLQYAVKLPDGTTTAYGDQSWVRAGLGARDHDGAATVVRDIWVSYGPWRTHETTVPETAPSGTGEE
jgi:hypothetical protein